MLLLYGVIEKPSADVLPCVMEKVCHADGQPTPTVLLARDGLGMVAAPCQSRSAVRQPTAASLLAYHAVIEAFFECTTIVPFRYGTVVSNEDQARIWIEERATSFHAQLNRIRGKAEVEIRLTVDAPCSAVLADSDRMVASSDQGETESSTSDTLHAGRSPRTGTAYLLGRRQAYLEERDVKRAIQKAVVQPYLDLLEGYIEEYRMAFEEKGGRDTVALALLTSWNDVAACRALAHQAEVTGAQNVRITGPWPPYSFVE